MRPPAKKHFGQHFLERPWVTKVLGAIGPASSDVFVEIGPGAGALTLPLANAAQAVVAVEIDRDLATALRSITPPNVAVLEADFLEITPGELQAGSDAARSGVGVASEAGRSGVGAGSEAARSGVGPGSDRPSSLLEGPSKRPSSAAEAGSNLASSASLRVVGNLPYNVASPILFKLVDLYRMGTAIIDATVMLQREVADRLLSGPGNRDYGIPSVLIGHSADLERLIDLPPGAFRPIPKVESTVVRLRFRPDRPAVRNRETLSAVVHAVFTRRRKTLANALLAHRPYNRSEIDAIMARADLDGRRRPESLSIEEFVRLSDEIALL